MRLHALPFRIFALFTALAVAILLAAAWILRWEVRRGLETEMGQKLEAVAQTVSVYFSEEERRLMVTSPGPLAAARIAAALQEIRQATDTRRLLLFDLDGRAIADTDSAAPGSFLFHLRFHPRAMTQLRQGLASHSILFTGIDGQPFMTGFAPLQVNGAPVGGVAVDGSAGFLASMAALERRLALLAGGALLLATILTAVLARTLAKPITMLANRARQIGRGRLDTPIAIKTGGEMGQLAETMEVMRQDLLARDREIKAMVGGVAHEVRNPLAGLALFSGLLVDRVSGDIVAKGHLQKIEREIDQIRRIVDHFQAFSKPAPPEPEAVDLDGLVRECVETFTPQSEGIQWTVRGLERLAVRVDQGQMRQILSNLISNAVQAAPDGEVHVTWTEKNQKAVIHVADTGPGMTDEVKGRLFTPFFTTRAQGTGLGLVIARDLAQRNGGNLVLAETGPDGTVFEIILPLADFKAEN